jgi:arylsulfatase A-like enzyme
VSDVVFTYAPANAPTETNISQGGVVCYPLRAYPDGWVADRAVEFLAARSDDEPFFLVLSTPEPHSEASPDTEVLRKYRYTVDPEAYASWNGEAGAVSPVTNAASATPERKQFWAARHEMLASVDDMVGRVMDECEARGWTDVTYMLMSDNGVQQGEMESRSGHDVWDFRGGKRFMWEGSVLMPLIIRRPGWGQATKSAVYTSLADVPLTILDFFGLTQHHAHTKRDGHSIMRLLEDPADPTHRRALPLVGVYKGRTSSGVSGDGIIDGSGVELLRAHQNHKDRLLFDLSGADYQVTDLAAQRPVVAQALSDRLDVLMAGRWDPKRGVNTCRTS